MLDKINNPSISIILESNSDLEAKVVDNITEYNNRIKEINIKVKQFKDSEKSIRYKIWGAIRELCNAEFEAFSKYENDYKIIYEQYQLELNTIKEQGDNNSKRSKSYAIKYLTLMQP